MSGTSADSLDAVAVEITPAGIDIVDTLNYPYRQATSDGLHALRILNSMISTHLVKWTGRLPTCA